MHNESCLDTSYELVELKSEKKHPEYKPLFNEYKKQLVHKPRWQNAAPTLISRQFRKTVEA